jgi:hypothetical protein
MLCGSSTRALLAEGTVRLATFAKIATHVDKGPSVAGKLF